VRVAITLTTPPSIASMISSVGVTAAREYHSNPQICG
jgi:hypothetical protein